MSAPRDPWPGPGRPGSALTLRRVAIYGAALGVGAFTRSFLAVAVMIGCCHLGIDGRRKRRSRLDVLRDSVPPIRRSAWERSAGLAAYGVVGTALIGVCAIAVARRLPFALPLGFEIGATCVVILSGWAAHRAWLGGIEVLWERGTLAPGRRVVFQVATTDGSSRLLGARFLLRCVGPDRWTVARTTMPVEMQIVALWQAEVRATEHEAPGPQQYVQIEFDIPPEAPPSGEYPTWPVHWELIVHGRSAWGDVTEAFEVPVGE